VSRQFRTGHPNRRRFSQSPERSGRAKWIHFAGLNETPRTDMKAENRNYYRARNAARSKSSGRGNCSGPEHSPRAATSARTPNAGAPTERPSARSVMDVRRGGGLETAHVIGSTLESGASNASDRRRRSTAPDGKHHHDRERHEPHENRSGRDTCAAACADGL
jgi:hypothetical protein